MDKTLLYKFIKKLKNFFSSVPNIPYQGDDPSIKTYVKNKENGRYYIYDSDCFYRSCIYYPGDEYGSCSNKIGQDPEWGMCRLCTRNPYSDYYNK